MTSRRLPIVIVLVGLLVAAVAAGGRRVGAQAGVHEPSVAAAMPVPGTRSSVWYCSGGPVIGKGPNGDQVTISNVGARSVRVAIDVMLAARATAEQFVTVAARATTTVPVARLSHAASAAVVVQPFGGDVVVEQGYTVNGDVAMAACATRTSSSWYFAAGSSIGGTQTWLSMLNPFAVDAVVDVEAYSEDGLLAPGTLQGLVVGHGSRLAVRIDSLVSQQHVVALGVRARAGSRIVATQAVIQSRTTTRKSASLSLGAIAPSHTWMFADNRNLGSGSRQLVIADPGGDDATAKVSVVTDVGKVIQPRVVHVPATSGVSVDFAGIVPAGASFTVVVQSLVPVVAETRDLDVDGFSGLATEIGATASGEHWSFAGGPFTATGAGGDQPRLPSGVDLAVVMKVGATHAQVLGMHNTLKFNGHVAHFGVVTPTAALVAFKTAQRDNPVLLSRVTSAMLPTTFDIGLRNDTVASFRRFVLSQPGVGAVVTAATQRPRVADDVVVMNPGSRPATVSLVATAGGAVVTGSGPLGQGLTNVVVIPGGHVTISLLSISRPATAVVVNATGPVVAERFSAGPWGVTRSPGVPWLSD